MQFEDGMAQPILTYSDLRDENYTNEDSDILRFCVYVETDYDTDNDGKADLVKVFMQVPKPAVLGQYQAAVIYDPTPYAAGTVEDSDNMSSEYEGKTFDYENLYKEGEKRIPVDTIDTWSLAMQANPEDWNMASPYSEGESIYNNAEDYNYYLVRGFALCLCSGIGTNGSEGFELCGMDLECESHKCVVEWLTGNRRAFTDLRGNVEVKADWSNGKVAMTGCSYGGTLPFEVATTGVKGLETIIPFAGIASWYDYTNSQGIALNLYGDYTNTLALYNAGGLFLDKDWTKLSENYKEYLGQIQQDQEFANGDYTDIWASMDYSVKYENIHCSALVVHGLNDFNVMTKQADLMYRAFKKAGAPVKLIFHQNGHNTLDGIKVGDTVFQEIMNKWLCHALYGLDNGIEDMPEVMAQSNVTGEFVSYDHWRDFEFIHPDIKTGGGTRKVSTKNFARYVTNAQNVAGLSMAQAYLQMNDDNCAIYDLELPEGTTIFGVPEVQAQLSTENTDLEGLMITAALIDVKEDGSTFDAYNGDPEDNYNLHTDEIGSFDAGGELGEYPIYEYLKSETDAKLITMGWTDLSNPDGGYDGFEYSEYKELEAGQYYPYTFFLQPTVYTVEPGHVLKLVLFTWDFQKVFLDEDYQPEDDDYSGDLPSSGYDYAYNIDETTLKVNMPVSLSTW